MHNYESKQDSDLILMLRDGDEIAFGEIYNRYWKKLFVMASNRIGNLQDGEEIVQDIFTSLWRRRESLVLNGDLSHYLAVSVKYRVIRTLDKHYKQQRYIRSLPGNAEIDNSTLDILDFEELQEELAKHVKNLPDKCQLVFRLSREQGYSQKQIASELRISEKTVEAHLGKAYKVLRARLVRFIL
jgi:RNA polymerase sigma-70 factor (family 1)